MPQSRNPSTLQQKKEQLDRFVETARKLGTDEDEAAFKEKLGVIARQKPKTDSTVQAKRKDKSK